MPLDQGQVFLDGVQFSTDPQVYQPFLWEKRYSEHEGLGGALTIQDFGTFMKDDRVHLASGENGFLETATVKALHTRFRTKGATYTLTDWLGNEFTVFITKFVPEQRFGLPGLFLYDMELHVLNIAKLLGDTYTGS